MFVLVDVVNGSVVGPFPTEAEAKVYVVDFVWGTEGWYVTELTDPAEVYRGVVFDEEFGG